MNSAEEGDRVAAALWRRLAAVCVLVGVTCVVVFLRVRSPVGVVPSCPTFAATGVHCPGCGSTRATHLLLNGAFVSALRHNAVLVLAGIPTLVWVVAHEWSVLVRARGIGGVRIGRVVVWGLLIAFVVFALVRNVPWAVGEWLRPPAAGAVRSA